METNKGQFSFDDATATTGTKVIQPGIHRVKTDALEYGLSQNKNTPYIDWKVSDAAGSVLSHRFYLSTTVGEGKTMSAWDIAKNQILQLVMASNNLDETTAKSKMPVVNSGEELTNKLSAIVAGKEFRLKVNGQETLTATGKFIKSLFGTGNFAESLSILTEHSRLKYSDETNIKRLPATDTQSTSVDHMSTKSADEAIGW